VAQPSGNHSSMSADAWRIKVVQRLPSIHSYKILNTGIVMFLNYHNNHIDIYHLVI
jgi:hypothetical protein